LISKIQHQATGGQILKLGDFLYLSPLSNGSSLTRRGGIPVLFPQFANTGRLQKHGTARNRQWILQEDSHSGSESEIQGVIQYKLTISSTDYPDWPYDARLVLRCNYQENQAHIEISIANLGISTFSWTGGLHPYFLVDLLNTKIYGLKTSPQEDIYRPQEPIQSKDALTFDEAAYESLFNTNEPLNVVTPTKSIALSMKGFNQWMIWNPGEEGAKAVKDLPNEDWCKFICIEPTVVTNPVILKPNQQWSGSLNIRITPHQMN